MAHAFNVYRRCKISTLQAYRIDEKLRLLLRGIFGHIKMIGSTDDPRLFGITPVQVKARILVIHPFGCLDEDKAYTICGNFLPVDRAVMVREIKTMILNNIAVICSSTDNGEIMMGG
jgi:hypothetical protein